MKIKLDENLPIGLADALRGLGHETHTLADENMLGSKDVGVWQAAQAEGRFLITQDLDFSDQRRFGIGSHCGLLILRLKRSKRRALIRRVRMLFLAEDVESWAGCLVIASDEKLRIRKPK